MQTFRVSGSPALLVTFVAAKIRALYPGAEIEELVDPGASGVRADVAEGRWLHVAPGTEIDEHAVAALSNGASAVVHLDSSPEEFSRAIRGVVNGERGLVPIEILQWVASQALAKGDGAPRNVLQVALTQREREILELVARGHSNSEIAEALTISANTVRTHLHALSVKLDATSRTKMLAKARALAIPEALSPGRPASRDRVSA